MAPVSTESLPSIDYDGGEPAGGENLFAAWESGSTSHIPAPLSVRRPRYRRVIVYLAMRYASRFKRRILSVGAGNGFTELALTEAGFSVLATDRSPVAVEYCRRKGLMASQFDFPGGPMPAEDPFDVLYCDGMLGHLWLPQQGLAVVWSRFAQLGTKDAVLILSNDLAERDGEPDFEVFGQPTARFFRPSAGWFAADARASGSWVCEVSRVLHYKRPKGRRRREVLVLKRAY